MLTSHILRLKFQQLRQLHRRYSVDFFSLLATYRIHRLSGGMVPFNILAIFSFMIFGYDDSLRRLYVYKGFFDAVAATVTLR